MSIDVFLPFISFYWIFRSHTHHWVLDFFCSTSAIIGTTIQLGEFFNWGKRFSFCIVILTECYQCTSVYDNRTESINSQNAMWCHPVENHCVDITNAHPRPRQNHPCSRRLRGHPQDGRHKRSTRASPSIGFQVRIPPRHRRCPDHWAAGRRCQLPRLKRGKPPLARRATAAAAAPAAAGCSRSRPDSCGRPRGRKLRPPLTSRHRPGGIKLEAWKIKHHCAWTWVPWIRTVAAADSQLSGGPAGGVQLETNHWVKVCTRMSGYIDP